VASGSNKVDSLAVNFTQLQNRTNFNLDGYYDNHPLVAAGGVEANAGTTRVLLERFSAKPYDIPVDLSAPSELSITGGTVTLNGLELKTGEGSVSVTGSAGETLDINAIIKELPASLANSFVPDLDAAGAISGKAAVTGTPAAPIADFTLDWKNAATSQTRAAGLSALSIGANGKFADNKLDFQTDLSGKGGVSLKAAGNFVTAGQNAQSLQVDADIVNIPAGLPMPSFPGSMPRERSPAAPQRRASCRRRRSISS
jgi:translocation and assembly module TamB